MDEEIVEIYQLGLFGIYAGIRQLQCGDAVYMGRF